MASGDEELDAMIRKVRSIRNLARESAPACAAAVQVEMAAQLKRGVDATGKPWRARKDGTPATLEGSDAELVVVAIGPRIYMRLGGWAARHHRGRARGGIVRAILPVDKKLPPKVSAAIRDVLSARFAAIATGG